MKKLLVMVMLLIVVSNAFAQNKKGNWLLGTALGSAGFSNSEVRNKLSTSVNTSISDGDNFAIQLYPNVGYYVTDHIVLGALVGVSYVISKSKSWSSNSISYSSSRSNYFNVSAGPFARFYI